MLEFVLSWQFLLLVEKVTTRINSACKVAISIEKKKEMSSLTLESLMNILKKHRYSQPILIHGQHKRQRTRPDAMADLEEQRRKVEELKKKILLQKQKGEGTVPSATIEGDKKAVPQPTIAEDLERKKAEEDVKRKVEEARIQAQRLIDEQKRKAEEEERRKDEERKKVEEEEKKKADEARLKAQHMAEEQRRKLEEETRRQAEEAAKKREEEARKKKDEETKRLAVEQERKREEEKKQAPSIANPVSLQAYAQALKQALADGVISRDESVLLETLRKSLGISQHEHDALEQETQLEIYLEAIVEGWRDGSITPEDSEKLDLLRENFKISAEEHLRLEKQVRQEILKQR